LTINVVGVGRKSGKTKLIQGLVRELIRKSYRVSAVKHISKGTFDTVHKDTWEHLHAGACPVIAVSASEVVSIKKVANPSLEDGLKEVPREVDLVLVEGFKGSENPKIIAAQSLSEVEELMREVTRVIAISGPLTLEKESPTSFRNIPILELGELVPLVERMILENVVKTLPGVNCRRCGFESCSAMAQAILEGKASINQCKTLREKEVALKVDGERVYLSEFPKNFVRNTILGMIKTLKGVGEKPSKISLELTLD